MQAEPQPPSAQPETDEIPRDLGRAGAVVEKAIEHMLGQHLDELAIASALLGGALEVLSRALDDAAIVQILGKALASVEAGHLRREEPGGA